MSVKIAIATAIWYNVKEITATAVGTKDEFGLLKRLATGDVCIYGSLKDGDIKYPIEWNDGGTFYIRKTIYQTISVDDMEYYASYDVQMSSNDEWVIFPSKNLEINLSSGSIKFTPVTGLYLVRKDADFLLSLEKGKSFVFNRDARIEYEATALSQEFHRKLQTYIALDDIFHNLGIKWDTPLNKISTDTRNALQKILNYKKGVYNERLSEKYTLFDCKLDGKSYPIVIGRRDNDRENDLFNAAYSRDLHAIDADSGGNYYRVPLINLLDDDMFAHLYLYDYEQLIEQIDYSQLNQHTVAAILHAALKLIKVYDRVRDKKLLDIANYAIDKLKTIDSGKAYLIINELQIKKRLAALSDDDILLLNSINDADPETLLWISVLKDDKHEANRRYKLLAEETKQFIKDYPMMTLLRELLPHI